MLCGEARSDAGAAALTHELPDCRRRRSCLTPTGWRPPGCTRPTTPTPRSPSSCRCPATSTATWTTWRRRCASRLWGTPSGCCARTAPACRMSLSTCRAGSLPYDPPGACSACTRATWLQGSPLLAVHWMSAIYVLVIRKCTSASSYCGISEFGACLACSAPRLAWQIASSLQFAPALRQLAAQVASRVGATGYNGLHLRVEEDMYEFTGAEGGVEVCHHMLSHS